MDQSHHAHVELKTIRAQMAYTDSALALQTACAIVACKLHNCFSLLCDYHQARKREKSDHARIIREAQQRIYSESLALIRVSHKAEILRIEARAARAYWRVIARLCHQDLAWRRTYPHARDSLNILLNTGYTVLTRTLLSSVRTVRILPEIGILHGNNSGDALVYDIVECFRQPAVDAVVLPLFSRKNIFPAVLDEKDMKKGFALLHDRMQKRFPYHGRCERLGRIMELEVLRLRMCMLNGIVWKPYRYKWGYSWQCGKNPTRRSEK